MRIDDVMAGVQTVWDRAAEMTTQEVETQARLHAFIECARELRVRAALAAFVSGDGAPDIQRAATALHNAVTSLVAPHLAAASDVSAAPEVAPPAAEKKVLVVHPGTLPAAYFSGLGVKITRAWPDVPERYPFVDFDAVLVLEDGASSGAVLWGLAIALQRSGVRWHPTSGRVTRTLVVEGLRALGVVC